MIAMKGSFTAAVWCVPALRVPNLHRLLCGLGMPALTYTLSSRCHLVVIFNLHAVQSTWEITQRTHISKSLFLHRPEIGSTTPVSDI